MKHYRSAAVAAAIAGALLMPAVAGAAPLEMEKRDGNPSCSNVDTASGLRQLKVEPVRSGTYSDGTFSVKLTVSDQTVSFTTTGSEGVDAVIVKGGTGANIYRYTPEVGSGGPLTTPTNPNNGQPYGLSHVSFCYDVGGGTPPKGKDGGGQKGGGQKSKPKPGQTCTKQNSKKCQPGQPKVQQGRMTGHGHQFNVKSGNTTFDKVQWEFRNSVCGADRFPDLKVEYGRNTFVLTAYVSPLTCFILDPTKASTEGNPAAGFDSIRATGTGTLNGVKGAEIDFRFTDGGEPGRDDTAWFTITAPNGSISYSGGAIDGGNHQAHRR